MFCVAQLPVPLKPPKGPLCDAELLTRFLLRESFNEWGGYLHRKVSQFVQKETGFRLIEAGHQPPTVLYLIKTDPQRGMPD